MDRSTVIVQDLQHGHAGAATLTLQRGVSTWASWTFQPSDAGTEITVGSASGCDWQVAAPGVPAIELVFTGEELFLWVEQVRDELRCNDATLPIGFTRLRHDDKVDLGPARIHVSLGAGLARRAVKAADTSMRLREHRPCGARGSQAPARVAELRVRRGASRLPSWTFHEGDAGKSMTIGASDECDLQVVAAGVEAQEVVVLFAGDTLLVKNARPTPGAKLNGRLVSDEWQFVRDADRLDMGTACVDVHIANTDMAAYGERTSVAESRPTAVAASDERELLPCVFATPAAIDKRTLFTVALTLTLLVPAYVGWLSWLDHW